MKLKLIRFSPGSPQAACLKMLQEQVRRISEMKNILRLSSKVHRQVIEIEFIYKRAFPSSSQFAEKIRCLTGVGSGGRKLFMHKWKSSPLRNIVTF